MNPSVTEFIESGVLELYVMGAANPQQTEMVEDMAQQHPEVREEINAISEAIERFALAHAIKPRNTIKPLVLATIDYLERMQHGELPTSPPEVTPASQIKDYAAWLERADMTLPSDADEIFAKVIGYTPSATTAIVWLKTETDKEVHHAEHERFLILEGTCDMIAGGETYPLRPGDFYAVPLHTPHVLKVTSAVPCKALVQRLSVEN